MLWKSANMPSLAGGARRNGHRIHPSVVRMTSRLADELSFNPLPDILEIPERPRENANRQACTNSQARSTVGPNLGWLARWWQIYILWSADEERPSDA